MDILKEKFNKKAHELGAKIKALLKEKGDEVIDSVTLSQLFGGARNIKMMVWETSELDAQEGIRFRGRDIPTLYQQLPVDKNGEVYPEGLFWLMLLDEIPTLENVHWLSAEWEKRSAVPEHVFAVLDCLPITTHPMTQFIVGLQALQTESIFAVRYDEGMPKSDYWDVTYEDTMNLIAKVPKVAAYVYRRTFHNNVHITPQSGLDWSGNFAHMLGIDKGEFKSFMRMYLTIHADHEGGNASAHTSHLVGSTLSDPYLSYGASMSALAGPLHGLANQEVIKWIMDMRQAIGSDVPTKEQISDFVHETLNSGQVIPGYGHAVLRKPDPRFVALKKFAESHANDDEIIQTVWNIFDVVPDILGNLGKVKNPWPNVDAHSGALLVHYGVTEYTYYTVLFGVARALGVLSSLCWSRALGMPLERPKSVTSEWVFNTMATSKVEA